MSTRASVHFEDRPYTLLTPTGETQSGSRIAANIYRHSDGYPEGLGEDLQRFFGDVVRNVEDNRFGDPTYLAAKFVVWQASQYARRYQQLADGKWGYEATHPLDFLGIGVQMKDPGDIEYVYRVMPVESGKTPVVLCETPDGERVKEWPGLDLATVHEAAAQEVEVTT